MMKLKGFRSSPPLTSYAPSWDFNIGTSICDDIDIKSFSKFLLRKEREIKKLPLSIHDEKYTDGYTGLGKNSTTSRWKIFNLLTWDYPEVKKLKTNIIRNIIEYNRLLGNDTPYELYGYCWYNVLRYRQKIKPHQHGAHSRTYLSGHFNVQVGNTSTCYLCPVNQINDPDVIDVKNEAGHMTIFPSYINHYTTPHSSFRPRITIAFDISPFKLTDHSIRL